jgi:hypothetical protein
MAKGRRHSSHSTDSTHAELRSLRCCLHTRDEFVADKASFMSSNTHGYSLARQPARRSQALPSASEGPITPSCCNYMRSVITEARPQGSIAPAAVTCVLVATCMLGCLSNTSR